VTGFYDVGALGEIAINLFHGYGYNFYRVENQLRTDDQKVRTLVSELLARAQKAVSAAEGNFRRERIPAPTRTDPFPPAAIMADARRLEAIGKAIGGVEGQVRHAPVPENDRMTQLYRDEGETLRALVEKDKLLIGQADTLRAIVEGKNPGEILAILPDIEEGVAAITRTLADRRVMII
jgi:hypothetical protein